MEIIEIKHLTKDYGDNRGIFDINLSIHKGEMVGFVGTNGSGKTTTIRNIMGFLKPTSGHVYVKGLESWEQASEIAKSIGYVPGEIAFPDLPSGTVFLKSQAEFLKMKDMDYANELIEKLQLDPRANLKRMSKGMKQKTALVAALMNNADIIILDEPTTGLDPLMRIAFLDIIKEEHKKGKTIFMSSHMFEEMEETCDRVALISDGRIIDIADMKEIRNRGVREFKIEFKNQRDYQNFLNEEFEIVRIQEKFNQITISVKNADVNKVFKHLKDYDVKFISEVKYTLEKHFKEIMMKNLEVSSTDDGKKEDK
ncbi:MAG: ATP-binding cassette domain-containing protein [Bacilli bacterium]|nr:ATP-binding cassette domain-containing protein [Bacilli bacterium]